MDPKMLKKLLGDKESDGGDMAERLKAQKDAVGGLKDMARNLLKSKLGAMPKDAHVDATMLVAKAEPKDAMEHEEAGEEESPAEMLEDLKEQEHAETPEDEAAESPEQQKMEKLLGLEEHDGEEDDDEVKDYHPELESLAEKEKELEECSDDDLDKLLMKIEEIKKSREHA